MEDRDDQEISRTDPFEGIDEIGADGVCQPWELQTQAIATIGALYLRLVEMNSPVSEEVTRGVGSALLEIIEDWRPRNAAIMAAAIMAGIRHDKDQ